MIGNCNQTQFKPQRQRQPLGDITARVNNSYCEPSTNHSYYFVPTMPQIPCYRVNPYVTQNYTHCYQNRQTAHPINMGYAPVPRQLAPSQYQQQQQYNQAMKNKKTDRTKYKTEMCKNWIEVGSCRYGIKCQFAHGEFELVGKIQPLNEKYKSKLCDTFYKSLYCPYGSRCLFIHDDRRIEDLTRSIYVSKLVFLPKENLNNYLDFQDPSESCKSPGSPRLPIFQEICTQKDSYLQDVQDETPVKVETAHSSYSPYYSQQTSCSKQYLYHTPDLTNDTMSDDDSNCFQSIYSDLQLQFSADHALPLYEHGIDKKDSFSAILDGEGFESETLRIESGCDKENGDSQFFINRRDIPLFI